MTEVNTYGNNISVSATNKLEYGAMAFGSVNNYDSSNVNIVVNNWSIDKFTSHH